MKLTEIFTNFKFSVGLKTFVTGAIAASVAYAVADHSVVAPFSNLVDVGLSGLFFEIGSYVLDVYQKSQEKPAE